MVTCPRCGRSNEGKYRFCLGCGAAMPAGEARQTATGPGAAQAPKVPAVRPTIPSGGAGADAPAGAPPFAPPPTIPPPSIPPPPIPLPPVRLPTNPSLLRGSVPVVPPPPLPAPRNASSATPSAQPTATDYIPHIPPPTPGPGTLPQPGMRSTVPSARPQAGLGQGSAPGAASAQRTGDYAKASADSPTNPGYSEDLMVTLPLNLSPGAGVPAAAATPRSNLGSGSLPAFRPREVDPEIPQESPAVPAAPAPAPPSSGVDAGTVRRVPRPPPRGTDHPADFSDFSGGSPGGNAQEFADASPRSRPPLASTRVGRPLPPPVGEARAATVSSTSAGGMPPQVFAGPSFSAAAQAQSTPPPATSCASCGGAVPANLPYCGRCGAAVAITRAPTPLATARPERVGYIALIDDTGAESSQFPLNTGSNRIGRGQSCQLRFPDDGFLAREHCIVEASDRGISLKPLDFANGTYLRITTPVEIHHGDLLRVGQEVLRFERIDRLVSENNSRGSAEGVGWPIARGVWGRLSQMGLQRQVANAYLLQNQDVFLGRERGDILFPKDGFVSGSHAVISDRKGRAFLKDLGSSNGTFLRIKQEMPIRNGDLFLLGRNLLRVHVGNGSSS